MNVQTNWDRLKQDLVFICEIGSKVAALKASEWGLGDLFSHDN